jgi:isopenicillin N synthase-like dioxygenase
LAASSWRRCRAAFGLGIDERIFSDAFDDGISTLRLLHYPKRPDGQPAVEDVPERFVEYGGKRFEQVARAHVDSGLLTVLAQCGFAINFGGLLERWTGGRIKATAHRVLAQGENRYSVPFFFEPRPSTRIAPLPIPGIRPFEPFLYGDHLWATATRFPENFGLGHLRPPRAPYTDPLAG